MSAPMTEGPARLRFIASYISGRIVGVTEAAPGELSHTDGQTIYVSVNAPLAIQRQEVLVQSALLGAGSLDPQWIKAVRGRPQLARRYLAVEGHRVLMQWARHIPTLAALKPEPASLSESAQQSLTLAKGRSKLP
ncbi:MAG: VWA domain-containing protein, partial [Ketobacter sp.]